MIGRNWALSINHAEIQSLPPLKVVEFCALALCASGLTEWPYYTWYTDIAEITSWKWCDRSRNSCKDAPWSWCWRVRVEIYCLSASGGTRWSKHTWHLLLDSKITQLKWRLVWSQAQNSQPCKDAVTVLPMESFHYLFFSARWLISALYVVVKDA